NRFRRKGSDTTHHIRVVVEDEVLEPSEFAVCRNVGEVRRSRPGVLRERYTHASSAADLSIERRVDVEVEIRDAAEVFTVDTDCHHFSDVVVDAHTDARMLHELVVEGDAPK